MLDTEMLLKMLLLRDMMVLLGALLLRDMEILSYTGGVS